MKTFCFILGVLMIWTAGCSRKESHHPWVESGMSRAEVLEIMGTPIRTDSIYHHLEFEPGSMSWESLDSIRRTLPTDEGNRMILGRPVDHSSRSDLFVSWYYGAVIVDTGFTYDRVASKPDSLTKIWFQFRKQRTVLLDARTMMVKDRGFSILEAVQL